MGGYRQMLVDGKSHAYINDAKTLLGGREGRRLTAKDVISELVGRRVRYLRLGRDIRDYINAFVSNAVVDKKVCGVLLFGSVAKNSFGRYSDIDVMVIVDSKDALGYMTRIDMMVKDSENARKKLVSRGFYLHISPLILSIGELDRFRPIYIDFLEEGIVLFERNETLTDFLNRIRKEVVYERIMVNDTMVMKWRIRGLQKTP